MSDPHDDAFAELIPELGTWNEGRGISIRDWLGGIGSYEHAIAYASLFWPRFVLHEDCVLFEGFSESSYRGFLEQTRGNLRSVESVMNHRHIVDLFPNAPAEPTRARVVHLGRTLKAMWAAKLSLDHPSRRFVVSFREEGIEDLLDYQLTFFTDRSREIER